MPILPINMPGKEMGPDDPFWKVDPDAMDRARSQYQEQLAEIKENEQAAHRLIIEDMLRKDALARTVLAPHLNTEPIDQDNQGEQ